MPGIEELYTKWIARKLIEKEESRKFYSYSDRTILRRMQYTHRRITDVWPAMIIKPTLCLLAFFISQAAWSTDVVHDIPRLPAPIEFDGKIKEGEWDAIDTLTLVSHWPSFSDKPNTRTWLRVAYDDKFFYFSAVCFDKPNEIQGPFFERDNWGMSMDQVAIILDTYDDNENGLIFVVTPTGSRIDVSLKNDAQGASPIDLSWNSYWEAHVSTDDNGWTVEARIPFSSLRFQSSDGNVTMGLIAYRYIARERQMDIFPNIPPQWGFWSFIKPSQAQEVSFSNVRNKRPWFTSPYLLARAGYHHLKLEDSPYPEKINDNEITVGLDVQHAVTDNLNLDVTVNTDFAQVEADDQVVNLSRFSFFFPEKRRFFLERSSIMDFDFEGNNRLFYSRRIGINEGRIVPLWGGIRLIGRVNNYDIGLLTMQSREKDGVPSENFAVLRLRRKISQGNSYIGGIFTSRTDWKGANNFGYGLDGIINLFGSDYLKVNVAGTYNSVDTIAYPDFLSDRKRVYIMWEKRSQVGFNYSLNYSQVDKNYAPGLGFEIRNNFRSIGDRVSYGWFPANSKSLRYVKFDLFATAYFSRTSHHLESFATSPSLNLEWKKNSSVTLTLTRFYDNVSDSFKLSDNNQIAPGEYVNKEIKLAFQTPSVHFLNAMMEVTAGTFYGGDRFSGSITPVYTVSKYLTLSGFYQYNYISFPDAPVYVAHVGRLKVATSLNVKLSINAFVQVNSISKVSVINFRLRYNPKDGNDLYFVYNETLNNLGNDDPYLPWSDYRAFIVKYVHTFHLGN